MPSIDNNFNFNLEDKIKWEEWSPSLQDKLKEIWNQLKASNAWIDNRIGDVRITIDKNPPTYPVPFNEVWFDTNIMALRYYTNQGWKLTHGAWFGDSNNTLVDQPDSPLSHNPNTNCHCYTIQWENQDYCHCKTQSWNNSIPQDSTTDMSFNVKVPKSVTVKKYRFEIESAAPSSGIDAILGTLNITTSQYGVGSITPTYQPNKVKNEVGVTVNYITTDEKYDNLFDDDYTSVLVLKQGKIYVNFIFGVATTITNIYGRLIPYSSGPVYINIQYQEDTSTNWVNLFNNNIDGRVTGIKLKGNYIPYSTCHSFCHCARW